MATLTIRDLDETLKRSLRVRAASRNRSMKKRRARSCAPPCWSRLRPRPISPHASARALPASATSNCRLPNASPCAHRRTSAKSRVRHAGQPPSAVPGARGEREHAARHERPVRTAAGAAAPGGAGLVRRAACRRPLRQCRDAGRDVAWRSPPAPQQATPAIGNRARHDVPRGLCRSGAAFRFRGGCRSCSSRRGAPQRRPADLAVRCPDCRDRAEPPHRPGDAQRFRLRGLRPDVDQPVVGAVTARSEANDRPFLHRCWR